VCVCRVRVSCGRACVVWWGGTLKKDGEGGALDAGHTLEAGLLDYKINKS
jgi:hypothetical protein